MLFSSWLRDWKRSLDRRRAQKQTRRQKPLVRCVAPRLCLEALEDRYCLSGGTLNAGFGTGGIDSNIPAASVAVQSNGDIVSAGTSRTGVAYDQIVITRVTSTGVKDTTFNGSGTVEISLHGTYDNCANTVLIQPDGKILVGGFAVVSKWNVNEQEFVVARLNPDGSLDKSFNKNGLFTWNPSSGVDDVRGLALLPNGDILATGKTMTSSGDSYALFRLTPSGTLDKRFGNQGNGLAAVHVGIHVADVPNGSIVQAPNGDILLCGSDSGGNADLVAFTSGGRLDTSYGNGSGYLQYAAPTGYNAFGFSSMVFQGNNLVMVGQVSTGGPYAPAGDWYGMACRYSLTGVLDTTFGTNGYYITSFPGSFAAITLAADGSILVAGAENYPSVDQYGHPIYAAEMVVGHLSANGQVDTTFGSGGTGFTAIQSAPYGVSSLALDGSDLVLGGIDTLAEVTAP